MPKAADMFKEPVYYVLHEKIEYEEAGCGLSTALSRFTFYRTFSKICRSDISQFVSVDEPWTHRCTLNAKKQ